MTDTKSYLHNHTVRLALLVILLVLISAASMLALLYQASLSTAREALAQQQKTNASFILNQMEFYQEIVDQLARRTRVKDLLNVGDAAEARQWILETQSQLPNSVSLALIRPDVEILGDPTMLRMGPSCIADLRRMDQQELIPLPPVHLDNRRLAHFDLTSEVVGYDGRPIGLLFASFSLEILQNTMKSLARPGQLQRIRDGKDQLLVQVGQVAPGAIVVEHIQPIAHLDWSLETHGQLSPEQHRTQGILVIATLVITAVLVLVVGGFAWRVRRH